MATCHQIFSDRYPFCSRCSAQCARRTRKGGGSDLAKKTEGANDRHTSELNDIQYSYDPNTISKYEGGMIIMSSRSESFAQRAHGLERINVRRWKDSKI